MSIARDHFRLPATIRKDVERVVRQKLGAKVLSISFKEVETTAEGWTVVIEITLPKVETTNAAVGQPSFFGLTRSVRNAMGNVGHNVFPVLRPVSVEA